MTVITARYPRVDDAREAAALIRASGLLDANSDYHYALWFKEWWSTSAVAVCQGALVGVLTGFLRPTDPSVYFSWQACVSPAAPENDIALRLYDHVVRPLARRGVTSIETSVDSSNRFVRLMLAKLAHHFGSTVEEAGELFPSALLSAGHYPEQLRRIRVGGSQPI